MILLGVNLDHVATLRQVRGRTTWYPDILEQVKNVISGGANQITVHLREDRRHIQDEDLFEIKKYLVKNKLKNKVSLNLEMACTSEMCKIALKLKPDWVCLVPEKRKELTTEGGLDVFCNKVKVRRFVSKLSRTGIRVSLFVDPVIRQMQASKECGADAVELHTGKYCLVKNKSTEFERLKKSAIKAHSIGLLVHAGHGLDFFTTKKIAKLPHLREVNIGHFLICDALNGGLKASVKKMKSILR